ncbi:MAG: site-specific DNA-methyltransferase [Candidatus Eisenbacteria bacterium]
MISGNEEIPAELATASGRLFRSDALALARSLPSGEVDLVYMDPPFGTGAGRAMLKGKAGRDGESGARDLAYADPRLDPSAQVELWQEVRRVVRPGGALFLHLDWRTVHAAKVLLDGIFGADNFLNEIIWHYATGGVPTRWFSRKHDNILYYVNGPGHTFHRLQEKKYLAHKMSRKGVPEYQDERGWYRYRFLDDVWQIPWLTQDSKERTGYPTQKPVALLMRILEACTEPGDLVADFFCGSGTTAIAAMRLGRRWLVGDESERAVEISRGRIEEEEKRIEDRDGFGDGGDATHE